MTDLIDKLPTDNTPIEPKEMVIIENIFKPENVDTINNVIYKTKDIIIAGIIFFIVSLPFINSLFNKYLPITQKSEYIGLCIKTLAFIIILFVVNNFYLSKK